MFRKHSTLEFSAIDAMYFTNFARIEADKRWFGFNDSNNSKGQFCGQETALGHTRKFFEPSTAETT